MVPKASVNVTAELDALTLTESKFSDDSESVTGPLPLTSGCGERWHRPARIVTFPCLTICAFEFFLVGLGKRMPRLFSCRTPTEITKLGIQELFEHVDVSPPRPTRFLG